MDYDPAPTEVQLDRLGSAVDCVLSFERRIVGGQSATTDILRCDDGRRVVLRRHGEWSAGFDDMVAVREATILGAVSAAGLPAPPVLWVGPLGGRTAMVTGFVDGVSVLDPSDGTAWAGGLAEALAALHGVHVDESLAALMADAPASPVDEIPTTSEVAHPRASEVLAVRSSLASTRSAPSSLTHGDYWPGNVLWRDDCVAAILDWEACRLGDPVADVAYCATEMRFLGRDADADVFVAEYRTLTGSELASLDYWLATALYRGLADPRAFIDAWRGLGHPQDLADLVERQDRLVASYLTLWQ